MDAVLRIELLDCLLHLSACEMLHDFLEGWVFLPNDFVESSSLDSGFLQLLIRCSGFHGLVLACITNQQNAVAIFEPVQKLVHPLCACEARFVQNVQVFLYASLVIALRNMPLQRARFDSGLCELLCGS